MGRIIEENAGSRYGRLTVIENAGVSKSRWGNHALWLCRCDCGNTSIVSGKKLRNGHTKSCGCLNREITKERATTHGQTKHPLYATWRNMIDRCLNPGNINSEHYGERGIQVYEPWRDDPRPFIEWIEENLGPRPKRHTLDRIDNDGNYEPGNLRWATKKVQAGNRHSYRVPPAFYRLMTEPIVFEYHPGSSDGE